ncbi:LysE family transporter [Ascidiimonas sp. W6]|uniref:LysE family transporter n=1 Tax=Ascidiimonas meishanensis TaxID=3128903 RepID=UPI0030EF0A96
MTLLFYFIIGFVVTFIGALPLGTVNLSVINTTIKQNTNKAMRIAYGAGVAEIILAVITLNFGMMVVKFIENHIWIQFLVGFALLAVGCLLLLKKQSTVSNTTVGNENGRYLNGFLLGLLNPPVLVYWVFITGFLSQYDIHLAMINSLVLLALFLIGVYLGKVGSLFFYSSISMLIKTRLSVATKYVNKFIGIVLVVISLIQFFKLLIL